MITLVALALVVTAVVVLGRDRRGRRGDPSQRDRGRRHELTRRAMVMVEPTGRCGLVGDPMAQVHAEPSTAHVVGSNAVAPVEGRNNQETTGP